MKTMTTRQQKVANEVQHMCAMALLQGRIHSSLPLSRFTIVDCWVSADLRLARLYLQLPSEMPQEQTMAIANHELAAPMRKYLAANLGTKFTPQVSFFPMEEEATHAHPTA